MNSFKIKIVVLGIGLTLLASTNLFCQTQYSFLVVEQEIVLKGMSYRLNYKLIHYQGSESSVTLLETEDQMSLNKLVDALNKLSKEGWELFDVYKAENLSSDDISAGMSGTKTTNYHQYLLRKKE
jgi:hypothetical protein